MFRICLKILISNVKRRELTRYNIISTYDGEHLSQTIKHKSACLNYDKLAYSSGIELASLSRDFAILLNVASKKICLLLALQFNLMPWQFQNVQNDLFVSCGLKFSSLTFL